MMIDQMNKKYYHLFFCLGALKIMVIWWWMGDCPTTTSHSYDVETIVSKTSGGMSRMNAWGTPLVSQL